MARPFPFFHDGTIDAALAEPHGSALAFLSDLHEQVEIQISNCRDDNLRIVLQHLRERVESAGLVVTMLGANHAHSE